MADHRLDEGREYSRASIWALLSNAAALAASMAIVALAVRVLDRADVGRYFLALVIVQLVITFGDIGLRNAVVTFVAKAKPEQSDDLSSYFLTMNLMSTVLVCSLLSLSLLFVGTRFASEWLQYAWYCVPVAFTQMVFQMGLALLAARRQFRHMSLVIAQTEFIRLSLCIAALWFGLGAVGLLVGTALSRVVGYIAFSRYLSFKPRLVVRHFAGQKIFRFSGWMYGATLLSTLNARMADGVLAMQLGARSLAAYSAALQVPSQMQRAFEAVKPVVLRYVSSQEFNERDSLIVSTRLFGTALTVVALVLVGTAHYFVGYILTAEYLDSVPILQTLCIWVTVATINYFHGTVLIGAGRTRDVCLVQVPQCATTILGLVLLLPVYQGLGAAIALLSTAVVGNLLTSWMVTRGEWAMFVELLAVTFKPVGAMVLLLAVLLASGAGASMTLLAAVGTLVLLVVSGVFRLTDAMIVRRWILGE